MNLIFSLTDEQISLAIELFDIKETDSLSRQQTEKALQLFRSLKDKRPDLQANEDIRPKKINNQFEPLEEYFQNPKRIIYLTRWTINILPYIELLKEVGNLPLKRIKDDFEGYLKDIFGLYLSTLKEINTKIPEKYNLLSVIDLKNVVEISKKIQWAVSDYFKGFPNEAFNHLATLIDENIMPKGYLNKHMHIWDNRKELLYKMRTGTNHTYSKEEMFHIPFEKRGLVSTNRYSIPGLPCVYLGNSPLTCWEELNRPDLNSVQTALFVRKKISYLNFSTPPGALIELLLNDFYINGTDDEEFKETYNELISYIVVWPLMAACSIRVKNPNDSFKPEYIIPQLLLQWIRQSDFDGISYFSTKIEDYTYATAQLYTNYAFPVQTQENEGYCSILSSKFDITDAIPWQSFQLYKASPLAMPNEEAKRVEFELIDGIKLKYSDTDFSRLEALLINKYT
ncbi:hypothetical protein ACFWGC_29900 [Cytobacillus pseudoceanisediminis]|uniref:hypothetical protein n=1 Tax=Cytobacillus pseudoceanisediminis TaxID=3051614 RepID=UPI00366717C4